MTQLEQPEGVRLANELGQQRDDWRKRAERAEALLRELFSDGSAYVMSDALHWICWFCFANLDNQEPHAAACPIARARALLSEVEP